MLMKESKDSNVVFRFDLSPITVVYSEEKMNAFDFLVNLCAIIGGFITVCSIIDSLLRNLLRKEISIKPN
jgi:hypothetical protein